MFRDVWVFGCLGVWQLVVSGGCRVFVMPVGACVRVFESFVGSKVNQIGKVFDRLDFLQPSYMQDTLLEETRSQRRRRNGEMEGIRVGCGSEWYCGNGIELFLKCHGGWIVGWWHTYSSQLQMNILLLR